MIFIDFVKKDYSIRIFSVCLTMRPSVVNPSITTE